MTASITLFINSGVIFPALWRTIVFSAVKMRDGRIKDPLGNEPDTKSSDLMDNANRSSEGWDVIWQSIMSSPRISDKTNAGRLLLPDKSVKGKGVITISPFTNLSKTHPPLGLASLLPIHFGSQNGSVSYLPFLRNSPLPVHPTCAPMPTTIGHCFLTYFLPPMFPPSLFFDKDKHFFIPVKSIKTE